MRSHKPLLGWPARFSEDQGYIEASCQELSVVGRSKASAHPIFIQQIYRIQLQTER